MTRLAHFVPSAGRMAVGGSSLNLSFRGTTKKMKKRKAAVCGADGPRMTAGGPCFSFVNGMRNRGGRCRTCGRRVAHLCYPRAAPATRNCSRTWAAAGWAGAAPCPADLGASTLPSWTRGRPAPPARSPPRWSFCSQGFVNHRRYDVQPLRDSFRSCSVCKNNQALWNEKMSWDKVANWSRKKEIKICCA